MVIVVLFSVAVSLVLLSVVVILVLISAAVVLPAAIVLGTRRSPCAEHEDS
jgi:hypothetical protein